MSSFVSRNKAIIFVIFFSFVTRLLFFLKDPPLWWDSAVYIGIGKSIFSFGNAGLWEPFRPLLWPVVLGFIWKVGANVVFFARILVVLLSLGCVFLVYLIGLKAFSKRIGLIAALFTGILPVFYQFSYDLNNHVPALFFSLLSVYFFVYLESKMGLVLSGVFCGLGFLTRFTEATTFLAIASFIFLLYKKRNQAFLKLFIFTCSFFAVILPYLVLNQVVYGNFLYPFIEANKVIYGILSTAPVFNQLWYYYFLELFENSFVLLFSIVGVVSSFVLFLRKKAGYPLLIVLLLLFAFGYHQYLTFKHIRYSIAFVPYLVLLCIYGLSILWKSKILKVVIFFLVFVGGLQCFFLDYKYFHYLLSSDPLSDYNSYFSDEKFDGEIVFSTTPQIAAYSDVKVVPLYMEHYLGVYDTFLQLEPKYNPSYVVFSLSDIPCPDDVCFEKRSETLDYVIDKYKLEYSKLYEGEEYRVFKHEN